MTGDLVTHESTVLKQLAARTMPLIVPHVLYSGAWAGGQSVLITQPLKLKPLEKQADCVHLAAHQLASLDVVETAELANSVYWGRIRGLLTSFEDGEKLLKTAAVIEKKWGQLVFDFGMSHGDWTRANLGLVDGQVAALDWERCTNNAPNGLDIAHFAIAESISGGWNRSIDATQVAHILKTYLKTANLPEQHAKPLILLASLEMVIRFKSAANVGLPSKDTKFEQTLHFGTKKWAHG